MSDVHPEFAEHVRAGLVNPTRNIRRALSTVEDGDAREYLLTAQEQLAYVVKLVEQENDRHVHRCSCGHTHYVQAEDA